MNIKAREGIWKTVLRVPQIRSARFRSCLEAGAPTVTVPHSKHTDISL